MSKRTQPYTVSELASAAGVSTTYVRRLVAEGKLSANKMGPLWTIPAAVADAWLAKRRERWEKF